MEDVSIYLIKSLLYLKFFDFFHVESLVSTTMSGTLKYLLPFYPWRDQDTEIKSFAQDHTQWI